MNRQSFMKYRRWMAGLMLVVFFGAALGSIHTASTSGKDSIKVAETRPQPAPLRETPPSPQEEAAVKDIPKEIPVQNRSIEEKAQTPKNPGVDIYLLARVIYAEARGEPFEGQVAVGAVLMNRLKNPRFPDSLQQIIFKRGEFCTVRDGQIWMKPNAQAIKAARLAASGWDPTGGAHYFYNPAKTTSRWIWSRPVTNRIGQHIFAA